VEALAHFKLQRTKAASLIGVVFSLNSALVQASTYCARLDRLVAGPGHRAGALHGQCGQPDPALMVTVTTFVVPDRAKGLAAAPTCCARPAVNSRAGDRLSHAKFRVGEEYVLFVPKASRLGLASPVGLAQGAGVASAATGKEIGNGRDFAAMLLAANAAACRRASPRECNGRRASVQRTWAIS
jgi:hypothetical protein